MSTAPVPAVAVVTPVAAAVATPVFATPILSADAETGASGPRRRRSRLPRWTRREIFVLIRGKREADGRGTRRTWAASGGGASPEPKWEAIASFCRRRGVERAAAQCQKRWSNLVGDYKRIKDWESREEEQKETFWGMRPDRKKDRKLPSHFDRAVYQVLDGTRELREEDMNGDCDGEGEEEDVVFDSGRRGEPGLFSDGEEEAEEEDEQVEEVEPLDAIPISERRGDSMPFFAAPFRPGANLQPPADQPEMKSAGCACHKKRKMYKEEGSGDMHAQLIEILKNSNQMMASHLEAHTVKWQVERDLMRDQTNCVIQVLGKVAEALGKIADRV